MLLYSNWNVEDNIDNLLYSTSRSKNQMNAKIKKSKKILFDLSLLSNHLESCDICPHTCCIAILMYHDLKMQWFFFYFPLFNSSTKFY